MVTIILVVAEATNKIILHVKGLEISEISLLSESSSLPINHYQDEERDFLIIEVADNFLPGNNLKL